MIADQTQNFDSLSGYSKKRLLVSDFVPANPSTELIPVEKLFSSSTDEPRRCL